MRISKVNLRNLKVSETLSLSSTADVSGEILIGKLSVEPGASLNGTCSMKGSVKELKNKDIEKPLNKFVRFTSIGLQMGLTIYLGSELGEWLDIKYQKENQLYFKIASLTSVFIAIGSVIVQVLKITKNDS